MAVGGRHKTGDTSKVRYNNCEWRIGSSISGDWTQALESTSEWVREFQFGALPLTYELFLHMA